MTDYHFYDPSEGHGLPHDPFNAIIAPRPIGWISTRAADDTLNLAPYSFFNAFNYRPPIIGFSSVTRKDSLNNVEATGEFVWNLATRALADQMNTSSLPATPSEDEFQLSGLTPLPSKNVSVPGVAEARVHFECKVTQIIRLETKEKTQVDSWVVFGEVVGVHIDKSLLKDGIYQTAAARPIMRCGGLGGYAEINDDSMFEMPRPTR